MLNVVVLTYVRPLADIEPHMATHIAWVEQAYRDGVFVASGRRVPRIGGVILAKGDDLPALEAYLREDPFQQHDLVTVEIFPFEPSKSSDALKGLL